MHGRAAPAGRGAGWTHVESAADGWWYTAPLPGGRRVLAFHTDADLPPARAGDALLEAAFARPELGALLRESRFEPAARWRAAAAESSELAPVAGDGWLAVGDAALGCDPLSSQGLANALYGGLAGAEALDRSLAGDASAPRGYAAAVDGVRAAYRRHLDHAYAAERRWPAAPFWRRRLTAR
jgi:flavin-dependent dehydrogenase